MRRAKTTGSGLVRDEEPASYECETGLSAFADDEILARGAQILQARMLRQSRALLSPADIGQFLSLKIGGCVREEFIAIWLDNKHRAIAVETLAHGTIDGAAVHSREVVRAAFKHNAAAVAFAHNHPSGDSTPSAADFAITARLRSALELIGVRLLDHFIVGGGEPPISMEKLGWVSQSLLTRKPAARRKAGRRGASK